LTAENMFRAYRVDVTPYLQQRNELVIAFRSLDEDLKKKRPRPRWKTNLVSQQQLRWLRTSLLGRIPGWSPPVPPVGPWRDVRLESGPLALSDLRLVSRLEGGDGVATLSAVIRAASPITGGVLEVGRRSTAVAVRPHRGGWQLHAAVRLPDP